MPSSKEKKRNTKPFTTIAIAFFALLAFLHLLRLFLGWEVTVNGIIVPMWVSVVGFLIVAGLAVALWREAHK
ncbi:MAG TPA: hypothetical protein VK138_03340 [Acidiferrobacterales bacterium]|nr:hypothetical protein [Acidiferrobacterales bacterium]